jgi:hypothetical protein
MWVWLAACSWVRETVSPPPIPSAVLEEVAPRVANLGHPNGQFVAARLAQWSSGDAVTHQRWVDVHIDYTRREGQESHTMTVRFYVEREDPCRISTDVLEDDGPEPVLLDNGIAAAAIGSEVCDALATAAL